MAKFIPTWHATSIYDIDIDFYKKNNIEYVISDLDNTLDPFDVLTPTKDAINLKKKLNENGIELIIISNNKSDRVKNYAKDLNVKCLHSARKPLKKRLLKFLKTNDMKLNSVIMIGDQTVTDILCANRAKIRSVLVDKLVERDQPQTKFNRFFDVRIRRRLKKKHLLNEVK